jgi:hypothetical protein
MYAMAITIIQTRIGFPAVFGHFAKKGIALHHAGTAGTAIEVVF